MRNKSEFIYFSCGYVRKLRKCVSALREGGMKYCFLGSIPGKNYKKWKSLEIYKNFILKKVISARYNKEKRSGPIQEGNGHETI
ncbi:hypothetical protein [Lacrimispora saccharolytica]|uniref:hypothetical protein n=1 Tax=Lacrimispora saccharolytica TaxID=84030 RepID=UPI00195E7D25|nr:hypothetical protein [Lacrimispora saccharolytica]QRV21838.1 hypothetical protein I6K70_10585 [Lacrimispora saccharolytica]